jgi:ribosomal protein L37E
MAVSSRWPSSNPGRAEGPPSPDGAPILRADLPPVGQRPVERAPAACPRCGSRGFNLHQRTWKGIRDPSLDRVMVLRYLCKRCGYAPRVYPVGVGPGRQSAATREITLVLGDLGISAHAIASLLGGLGCRLSASGVRNNLRRAGRPEALESRLHLTPSGPTSLRGLDGALTVRLTGSSTLARSIEIEVGAGPQAPALLSRLRRRIRSHQEVRAPAG